MEQIFINTEDELDSGEEACGEVTETGQEPVHIAIRCIREATFEEYFAWVAEKNLHHMVKRSNFDGLNFYLVEVLD